MLSTLVGRRRIGGGARECSSFDLLCLRDRLGIPAGACASSHLVNTLSADVVYTYGGHTAIEVTEAEWERKTVVIASLKANVEAI